MSNINIQRAVENIRSTTTVFTPIVEVVVNAIEAIEEAKEPSGVVRLKVRRSQQELNVDEVDSKILDILVEDNGIGFTDENRSSFDTLYSARKIRKGGKGFGRFTCLRYFDDFRIDSTFRGSGLRRRQFEMGKETELIVNERISEPAQDGTGTTVTLASERTGKLPRKLSSLARGLVELLLPYFSTKGYVCPRIELSEPDGTGIIVLNDYVDSRGAIIHEVSLPDATFTIKGAAGLQTFEVRVFQVPFPAKQG